MSPVFAVIVVVADDAEQAAHKKIFFLFPYAVAIFFGMLYNFFNWITSEEDCLDPKSLSLR
jgi:hypothetical protein